MLLKLVARLIKSSSFVSVPLCREEVQLTFFFFFLEFSSSVLFLVQFLINGIEKYFILSSL